METRPAGSLREELRCCREIEGEGEGEGYLERGSTGSVVDLVVVIEW